MTEMLAGSDESGAPGASTPSGRPDGERPPSDAQLLAAALAGETEAWDTLVSRYSRLVYSIGLREGLDEGEAADVVVATFLALLDALETFEGGERPSSWLVSRARQEIVRVQRGRVEHRASAGRRSAVSTGDDPAASSDWDRVTTLHRVLAQLSPHQRELIDRAYLDHAHPQVGTPQHRPAGADAAHDLGRSRALDRVRHLLAEENES